MCIPGLDAMQLSYNVELVQLFARIIFNNVTLFFIKKIKKRAWLNVSKDDGH